MVIYGSEVALDIRANIKNKIDNYVNEGKRRPGLAVILVGNNPASLSYVKGKSKACNEVGVNFKLVTLDENITQDKLHEEIHKLNEDETVDGILVQLPLPQHLDEQMALEEISHLKDVDGLTEDSAGKMFLNKNSFKPCTPLGIIELLKRTGTNLCGKEAVVVGRSNLVGLPVSRLLISENATVTVCHSRTKNLKEVCKRADILVVAIGKPKFINHEYIKDNAIVIDVGVNRVDGHLCGDVDFEDVKDICSWITPVPKGVGPMTIAMLLSNTLKSYEEKL